MSKQFPSLIVMIYTKIVNNSKIDFMHNEVYKQILMFIISVPSEKPLS